MDEKNNNQLLELGSLPQKAVRAPGLAVGFIFLKGISASPAKCILAWAGLCVLIRSLWGNTVAQ